MYSKVLRMTSSEQIIATFQTRVRDLLLRFQQLKKENEDLYAMVAKNEEEMKALQAKLAQADNDYNTLKMAKMMEISDGDLETAKARVAKLIREVNKCIAILSDEQ